MTPNTFLDIFCYLAVRSCFNCLHFHPYLVVVVATKPGSSTTTKQIASSSSTNGSATATANGANGEGGFFRVTWSLALKVSCKEQLRKEKT